MSFDGWSIGRNFVDVGPNKKQDIRSSLTLGDEIDSSFCAKEGPFSNWGELWVNEWKLSTLIDDWIELFDQFVARVWRRETPLSHREVIRVNESNDFIKYRIHFQTINNSNLIIFSLSR